MFGRSANVCSLARDLGIGLRLDWIAIAIGERVRLCPLPDRCSSGNQGYWGAVLCARPSRTVFASCRVFLSLVSKAAGFF